MTSRTLRTMVALVLLTVVVCSISESFDSWDNTAQTGVDTESTLILTALCVGATIAFTRFVFRAPSDRIVSDVGAPLPTIAPLLSTEGCATFVVPIPLVPALPLRI